MQLGSLSWEFPVFLAPMAGVTDMPFRSICKGMGCDMTYTEMVSAKGLLYGGAATKSLLLTAPAERPCGVQLFGRDGQIVADMAKRIQDEYANSIAIIDINMGCPAHKIVGNGEGSALMQDLGTASAVIEKTAKAVSLPVTVKFRKGWDDAHVNAVAFAKMAENSGASAVCVHGRTRMQMYSGKADWEIIRQVKEAVHIPVLGNGDLFSGADVLAMRNQTGCDGVMVARGAQGNPWLFREINAALSGKAYTPPTAAERIQGAIFHAKAQEAYSGAHGVIEMRKHIAWYLKGIRGANALRVQVNGCTSFSALYALLEEFAGRNPNIP
ncbi:MAG: tRNA dihydrouridine synthase DusB [Eubacteriales bacterium]|nr:tRNA dihydrouridine synthase DusB [Eubacteriales bacterium]